MSLKRLSMRVKTKQAEFYLLAPISLDPATGELVPTPGARTSLVDCHPSKVQFFSCPAQNGVQPISLTQAHAFEQRFTAEMKRPCIIYTDNMVAMKATKVDAKEAAKMLRAAGV